MAKLFHDDTLTEQPQAAQAQTEQFTISPEEAELHQLMNKITTDFETLMEDFFNQWGITTSRFAILHMLYHKKEGMTPTETAKKVGVTNATISAILSGLKESGLIQSVQNAGDSRSYRVTLSEGGLELLKKIYPQYNQNIGRVWSHFDTQEKKQMNQLLTRFSQVMGVLKTKF